MAGYLWNKKRYRTQQAVADAAGVNRRTVTLHLEKHGHLDLLGVPHGRHKPVMAGGHSFPSMRTLELFIEVPRNTIRRWQAAGQMWRADQAVKDAIKEMRKE